MSRYIDADELIFIGLDNPDDDHLFEFVPKEFIDNAPTADVVEVVHGEWKECETVQERLDEPIIDEWQSARCSVCGKYHTTPYMYHFDNFNYCPNCGADMRGGTE